MILALLLLPWIGCARAVILHPIEKTDIFRIEKGTTVGNQVSEKDGWFLSDLYMEEIIKARLK